MAFLVDFSKAPNYSCSLKEGKPYGITDKSHIWRSFVKTAKSEKLFILFIYPLFHVDKSEFNCLQLKYANCH